MAAHKLHFAPNKKISFLIDVDQMNAEITYVDETNAIVTQCLLLFLG